MDILLILQNENKTKEKIIQTKMRKLLHLEDILSNMENKCRICMEKEVNRLFLPCKHLASCDECVVFLKFCHICRSTISTVVSVLYCADRDAVLHPPHISSLGYKL